MSKAELKNIISSHITKRTGQSPTEQELTESTDHLLAFFELLIEADKKLMKPYEPSNNGNPNNPD